MTATNGLIPVSQAGNGVQVAFDFAFKIFDATDIVAYKGDAAVPSVFTLGVLGVDYTVAFDTEAETGTVTWMVAPVGGGGSSVISRASPRSQDAALPREAPMPEETLEAALDKLTLADQELEEKLSRALVQPVVPPSPDPIVIDAPIDGRGAQWVIDGGVVHLANTPFPISDAQATETAVAAAAAAAADAAAAAASAAAAAAAAASVNWRDVVFLTFASSPYAVTAADRGKVLSVDATGGAVVVNLPTIVSLVLTSPFNIAVKKTDAGGNTVTINRGGATDTIDGATNKVLAVQNAVTTLIPDTDPAPDLWTSFDVGVYPDGSVTTAKLNDAVFSGLTAAVPVAGDYVALSDVSAGGVKRKALVSDIVALAAGANLVWTKYTKIAADFAAAATTNSITLFTAPAGTVIHAVKVKHSTAFSGGGITAYNVGLGITGNLQKYATNFNVFQVAAATTFQLTQNLNSEDHGATWDVKATANSTGANLNAAGAGSVDIWVLTSIVV
jgi:hypothetical protein